MSAQRSVQSQWRGGLRCEVTAGDFVIIVDEPKAVGGNDSGPQPTELLLASVASCFTIAIAYLARKRSIELRDLTVTVTGIYDGPRFRAVSIQSRVGCEPSVLESLVQAAERVCYVTNTLRSGVEISIEAIGTLT